jgi:hypothetical protein
MRITTLLLVSGLCLVGACSGPERDQGPSAEATPAEDPSRPLPSPFPDVVARINGQPIRFAQIVPLAREALSHLSNEEQEAGRPAAVRQALQRYIDRELLFQEAQARGLSVDERRLEWTYDQTRQEYPDDQEWEALLAEEGMDPQALRAEIRVQHMVGALLDDEAARAGIGDGKEERERLADELARRLRARARIEIFI